MSTRDALGHLALCRRYLDSGEFGAALEQAVSAAEEIERLMERPRHGKDHEANQAMQRAMRRWRMEGDE